MAKAYLNIPISDMKAGDDVEGFFLLSGANVKTSAKGGQFLAGKLKDKSAEIDFKIWDYASDIHEQVGSVVKIRGSVSEYNGSTQLIVERIRLAQSGDTYSLKDLVPCAPIDIDKIALDVEGMLNGIRDNVYRAIALTAYDRMKDFLKVLPAAKTIHHAFLGGWLMHTSCMMNMAYSVSEVYGSIVNLDLLLCGAFCHDIGKRKEYVLADSGLVKEYSTKGTLLGHPYMGAAEIAEIAAELKLDPNDERVILLQHMLLSHHGEPDWGAAVAPYFLEAEILYHLDVLDARIEAAREALEGTEAGTMTDYVKAFGHALYQHH